MRHVWILSFLIGCSLVADTDEFRFGDPRDAATDTGSDGADDMSADVDAGVDAGADADADADADDGMMDECRLDSECDALPHSPGLCVDGMCANPGCEAGYAECDDDPTNGCEVDTRSDDAHCGGCGMACTLDHAVTMCSESECAFVMCDPGFDDCDATVPGCEADLSEPETCGSCSACGAATPLCDNTGASPVCVADCPDGTTLCGTSRCADLTSDPSSCGSCDRDCDDLPGSSPTCAMSGCGFACDDRRGDCTAGPGCETDTSVSVLHCGGCDAPCEGGSATWSCAASACVVETCVDEMNDCDDAAFGCESDPMTDALHCGGCGMACDAGESCIGGVCNPIVGVDTGSTHACAVQASGAMFCWGLNIVGAIGDGTGTHRGLPTRVPDFDGAAVSVGDNFTCALDTDGAAWCWGRGGYGELGSGVPAPFPPRFSPSAVDGDDTFDALNLVQIESATSTSCVRGSDGSVWCWGRNQLGQLGVGTTANSNAPQRVSLGGSAIDLGVGSTHACALLEGGTMECWGRNQFGQLGSGVGTPATSTTPTAVELPEGVTFAQIAVGNLHTCARTEDARVYCWGYSDTRSTGLTAHAAIPTLIDALGPASDLQAGGNVTCARLASGYQCLGDNTHGSLGRGTVGGADAAPAPIEGLTDALRVFPGLASCAIARSGRLVCWGDGRRGMLGREETVVRRVPTPAVGLDDATKLAIGTHAGCAIAGGELRCWGSGQEQLTLGVDTLASLSEPRPVDAFSPSQIAIGVRGACGVDGMQAHCWGIDDFGRYGGIGTSPTPTLLPVDPDGATENEVATASEHACVRRGGTVLCAGRNAVGQLGRGTTGVASADHQLVSGLVDADQIGVGENFSCARRTSGSMVCWGLGTSGQLGSGARDTESAPVPVVGLSHVLAFDLGGTHGCAIEAPDALATTGTVYCWGADGFGAVGIPGTSMAQPTPVETSVTDAIAVAAGNLHTCALSADGTVRCWGRNNQYQMGNGTTTNLVEPTVVGGFLGNTATPTIDSSALSDATCALATTGVVCWGECYDGACATGAAMADGIPAPVVGL